jgi:hypothetical protein
MPDYYAILEIEFGASMSEVKKAYRKLALKYHPDQNSAPDAKQKFIEITEAYEVLTDPKRRWRYDQMYQKQARQPQEQEPRRKEKKAYEEWARHGRKKAREYSSMAYQEFIDRAMQEAKVGASYIPNVIAILFTAMGAVALLTTLPEATDGGEGILPIILLMVVGLGYLTYRLFAVMRSDYAEDRKRKL